MRGPFSKKLPLRVKLTFLVIRKTKIADQNGTEWVKIKDKAKITAPIRNQTDSTCLNFLKRTTMKKATVIKKTDCMESKWQSAGQFG